MDAIDELPVFPTQKRLTRAGLALRFAIFGALLLSFSAGVSAALLYVDPQFGTVFGLPTIFLLTSLLLGGCSYALARACEWVRVEKQRPFRTWLVAAALIAALFTAVQAFGLATLVPAERSTELAQTGSVPFAIGVISMHALHVIVAQLALAWIVVQAFNDRYDHEFFRPVTYCAWFWHFLGGVWLSLLAILVIAL